MASISCLTSRPVDSPAFVPSKQEFLVCTIDRFKSNAVALSEFLQTKLDRCLFDGDIYLLKFSFFFLSHLYHLRRQRCRFWISHWVSGFYRVTFLPTASVSFFAEMCQNHFDSVACFSFLDSNLADPFVNDLSFLEATDQNLHSFCFVALDSYQNLTLMLPWFF